MKYKGWPSDVYFLENFKTGILAHGAEEKGAISVKSFHIDLITPASNFEIIERFGGLDQVKRNAFTCGQIRAYVEQQLCTEGRPLVTNFKPNIFYVLGNDGQLDYVRVLKFGSWEIGQWDVVDTEWFEAGSRVFFNTAI